MMKSRILAPVAVIVGLALAACENAGKNETGGTLIGAAVGHYVMGLNLNILSMFALVALSGIVVNNSIILVATIERRRAELEENETEEDAVVQGTIDRLRPVLLTSMTTIGGLSTLMFETSLQAQFLIPMATTIVFGLAVTTALVLFLVPATLGISRDLGMIVSAIWRGIKSFFRLVAA